MDIKRILCFTLMVKLCLIAYQGMAQTKGAILFVKGLEHNDFARYDSALHCFNLAQIQFAGKNDAPNQLKTKLALAKLYHTLALYDTSFSLINEVEKGLEALPGKKVMEFELNAFYLNHYIVFASFAKAKEYYNKLATYEKRLTSARDRHKYYYLLSQYHCLLGDYFTAMQCIDSAIVYSGKKIELAKCIVSKQLIAYRQTNYGLQSQFLDHCGALIEELGLGSHWINAKMHEGRAYWHMDAGQLTKSLYHNKISFNILRRLYQEEHPEIANIYNQLGIAHGRVSDSARYYHNKSLIIRQKLFGSDNYLCSFSYNNLGNYYKPIHMDSAIGFYKKAIRIRERDLGLHHPKMANAFLKMADLYHKTGQYKQQLKYAHLALCASFDGFADTSDILANPVIGTKTCTRETILAFQAKMAAFYYIAFNQKTDTSLIYILEQAYICSNKMDTILVNCYKNGFVYDDLGFMSNYSFLSMGINLEKILYNKTGETKYIRELLKNIDLGKSSSLFNQALLNRSKSTAEANALLSLQKEKFALLKTMFTNDLDAAQNSTNQERLKRVDASLNNSETALRLSKPELFAWLNGMETFKLMSLKEILPPKTAIINLSIALGEIKTILISKDTISISTSNYTDLALPEYYSYRMMLEKGFEPDTLLCGLGHQLYKNIFSGETEALLEKQQIEKLIILPELNTWTIPFEALITNKLDGIPQKWGEIPFLIKKYEITYAPSLFFAWQNLTQKQPKAYDTDILLVAPVFKDGQTASADLATRNFMQNMGNEIVGDPNNYKQLIRDGSICALPYTETEVGQIGQMFKAAGHSTKTLLNRQANPEATNIQLNKPFRIAHIASHAFTNLAQPDLSGILLAGSKKSGGNIFFAGDIKNLDISCDLVVLSACETAFGKVVAGDGMYNLSQSFAAKGVPNVLASLWKVADYSTSILMVDFYRDLLKNNFRSYAQSLRNAKLKMIENETYGHPFYWAPFVLSGY
jgi:CHAT domain-containing protein